MDALILDALHVLLWTPGGLRDASVIRKLFPSYETSNAHAHEWWKVPLPIFTAALKGSDHYPCPIHATGPGSGDVSCLVVSSNVTSLYFLLRGWKKSMQGGICQPGPVRSPCCRQKYIIDGDPDSSLTIMSEWNKP